MRWIALQWRPEAGHALPTAEALGWWALQFTPRVVWVDEALLLEVGSCERLWGGRRALMRRLAADSPDGVRLQQAHGATSLVALARLRLYARGERPPADDDLAALPLATLTAAHAHLDVLAHLGCHNWGDVAALPRAGLVRRFGAGLRTALDEADGLLPERYRWLTLPEVFDQKIELPALAEDAPALLWSAHRLLTALQLWLRGRQRGVLAFEIEWTLDLKRYDGVDLPPHQALTLRTAEATQDMAHLRRLLAERLASTSLSAPASWLRLRSIETAPWVATTTNFLPDTTRPGDKLHALVERLSARLGAEHVLRLDLQADHRPEAMQRWRPALQARGVDAIAGRVMPKPPDVLHHDKALHPPWLLAEPLRLNVHDGHPCYGGGPLRRLVGPQRVEAGWWCGDQTPGGRPAVRDYYIAQSPQAGLVWVFREAALDEQRWFLQGLYA